MRTNPTTSLAALVVLASLTAACSGTSTTPSAASIKSSAKPTSSVTSGAGQGPAAVPQSGLTKGMVLPLEAYEESYPDTTVIQQARFTLEGQCMREYGFTFTVPVDTASAPLNYDASNMARRYGLADMTQAKTQGYNVMLTPPQPGSEPSLSAAEQLVLTGGNAAGTSSGSSSGKAIPQGGCVGDADRRIGSLPSNLLADQLDAQSLTASQSDPAVVTAIHQWSACLKQHGFTVASPYDASSLSGQLGSYAGSDLDKTIAVADVGCKQSTNLVTTWFNVETRLQNQYIATNQLALQQQQTELNNAVKTATAVVGG